MAYRAEWLIELSGLGLTGFRAEWFRAEWFIGLSGL